MMLATSGKNTYILSWTDHAVLLYFAKSQDRVT